MTIPLENQKILCLYHFFDGGIESRKNLAHFLAFGMHDDLDIHLLISGEASPELLEVENVTTHTFANFNLDFGAISSFLNSFNVNLDQYSAAIVVNSSARGPFCSAHQVRPWFTALTDKLSASVAIVGATISELPSGNIWEGGYEQRYGKKKHLAHAQTYCFAISIQYLTALVGHGFFNSGDQKTKLEVIRDYEIRLSGLALDAGLEIDCLLPGYGPISSDLSFSGNLWAQNGDPIVPNGYFGRTLHPFEVLFVKTNRALYDSVLLDSLATSMVLEGRAVFSSPLAPAYFDDVLATAGRKKSENEFQLNELVV